MKKKELNPVWDEEFVLVSEGGGSGVVMDTQCEAKESEEGGIPDRDTRPTSLTSRPMRLTESSSSWWRITI